MIPRFIILKAPPHILDVFIALGYEKKDNPLTEDVLVLGTSLLNSTTVPDVKNPLIKQFGPVFDVSTTAAVFEQAELQKKWTGNLVRKELQLGADKKGKVIITPLGVMIDSYIIPIATFRKVQTDLQKFKSPFIASHTPFVNPVRPFLTVGCDDYSLADLSTIISAYEKLLEPAS